MVLLLKLVYLGIVEEKADIIITEVEVEDLVVRGEMQVQAEEE